MNNGMANLVVGSSTAENGVIVTHLVRGVEFGKISITYEHGKPTLVERVESIKLRGVDDRGVTRLL